jgi:hypothetical protein
MTWIVKIAFRAPYTFTVLAVLLLIGGVLGMVQIAKDNFPPDANHLAVSPQPGG